jgi:hypothetical protein
MKNFKIKDYIKSPQGYEVHLGNGTVHTFKTLAKMKAFLAETNRFLTDSFFQINELYTQAYCTWRAQFVVTDWVVFDNRCRSTLEAAEGVLFNSWHKSGIHSGTKLSFINQNKAIDFIEVFIDELLPLVVKRSDTYNRYKLESMKTQLMLQRVKLHNFSRRPDEQMIDKPEAAKEFFDLKITNEIHRVNNSD